MGGHGGWLAVGVELVTVADDLPLAEMSSTQNDIRVIASDIVTSDIVTSDIVLVYSD